MKIFNSIWLILLIICGLASCENKEAEPALADQIMGDYEVNSYNVIGVTINLPATSNTGASVSGKVLATKISESTASFTFIFTQTQGGISNSSNAKLENITLKKSGTAIESADGLKSVQFDGSKLTLVFPNADPSQVLTVFATKTN